MAEQKQPETIKPKDMFVGVISPSTYYGIKNKATGMVLDDYYGKEIKALNNDISHPNHQWSLLDKGNGWYAIKNKATGQVLDHYYGKSIKPAKGDGNHPNHQWKFIYKGDGYYAIKNKATGKVLDHYYGKSIQAYNDDENHPNHQWLIIPLNFKLKAAISDFDFGDEKEMEQLLDGNKKVAFADKKRINCAAIGIEASGEYGESVQETFSFGFSETIGASVEVEVSCGVPAVAEAKTKVTTSFEFSANQQWTKSEEKNFKSNYKFTPQETGIYEVGMIVYVVKDQKLPFKATVTILALDDNNKQYSGEETKSFLYYSGFDCKIKKVTDKIVEASISGTITATFACKSDVYSKKIGDLQ